MQEVVAGTPGRVPAVMALALTLLVGTLTACSGDAGGPVAPPPVVAALDIAPGSAALVTGDTVRLAATPRSAAGTPLTGRQVVWSSSDTLVATVTASGLVAARGVGVVTVRATVDGRWAEVVIAVSEPVNPVDPTPVVSHISPGSIPAGSPGVTIVVTGAGFAPGAQVLWNGTPRPAEWIGSTELRLTLGPTALKTEGVISLAVRNPRAAEDSPPASFVIGPVAVDRIVLVPATLMVPVGGQAQLTPTAYSAGGAVLSGRAFTWRSSAGATASVSATGLVTAHHVGEALITVEADGRMASASVSVVVPVGAVIVHPNPAAVLVHSSVQLRAMPVSATGGALPGRAVTWASENADVATVDQKGVVTGVSRGTARIRADSEGRSGWATVEVRQYADGPVQGFGLRGTLQGIMPAVGTTDWVDQSGVSHPATLFLSGGELTMDGRDSRYQQTLQLDVVVAGRGTVGRTVWSDTGSFEFDWGIGQVRFRSALTNSEFTAVSGGPGAIIVDQAIGTAPPIQYSWVIQ